MYKEKERTQNIRRKKRGIMCSEKQRRIETRKKRTYYWI